MWVGMGGFSCCPLQPLQHRQCAAAGWDSALPGTGAHVTALQKKYLGGCMCWGKLRQGRSPRAELQAIWEKERKKKQFKTEEGGAHKSQGQATTHRAVVTLLSQCSLDSLDIVPFVFLQCVRCRCEASHRRKFLRLCFFKIDVNLWSLKENCSRFFPALALVGPLLPKQDPSPLLLTEPVPGGGCPDLPFPREQRPGPLRWSLPGN